MKPVQPLIEELDPAPPPWALARALARMPHLLFLDSAGGPAHLTRYSYLMADPFAWLCVQGPSSAQPFDMLSEALAAWRTEPAANAPPFQGGAAGLFGYGLAHWLESLPPPRADEFRVPDLAIGLYDWVIAWDHVRDRAFLISTGFPETHEPVRKERARARLEAMRTLFRDTDWQRAEATPAERIGPEALFPLSIRPCVFSNFDQPEYLSAVRRAVEYTHAGDCFQVNLSQRLLAPATIAPLELYGRLRERNPAPFAGYFNLGDFQIASASPERFLHVRPDGFVHTHPIKGTRPRGDSIEEDRALIRELLDSAKDRAENVMIVDLLRNDLGRVCEYGSVAVAEVCRLETYPTVHHLVSTVQGRLRSGLTAVDLLKAAFPGGSVTGAPKVRAMQIIAELEPTARGAYCGSLGWLGFNGAMDSNILIRTFTAGGGWFQFPVGGGIVADSDPQREYEETLHKAAGLLRALE
jgi:para-aminobenzoate synthetase component 1